MTINHTVQEKAKALPEMMRFNIYALKAKYELHQFNFFKFRFHDVVSAFLKKYEGENQNWTTTTIAHISMLDDDKFQIVRRQENCLTSKPTFDRIIVDRKELKLSGFTFENMDDSKYQEAYTYQQDPVNKQMTIYNAYTFRSLGMRIYIRQKAHAWGIQTLEKIMIAD